MARNASLRSLIQQRIKGIYKKYIVQFEKDVMQDIKSDFKDSIDIWIKTFTSWKQSKNQPDHNRFDVLYAASSLYPDKNPNVKRIGEFGYISQMEVGPEYLDQNRVKFISQWGDASGNVFPNTAAYNLMYEAGIYGYCIDIVKRSWYKNEKPSKRKKIIDFLLLENVIPPNPFDTPDSIMNQKFKRIQSQAYLDRKWEKYNKKVIRDLKNK